MYTHGAILTSLRNKRKSAIIENNTKAMSPQLAYKLINEKTWVQPINSEKKIKTILQIPRGQYLHEKSNLVNKNSKLIGAENRESMSIKNTAVIEYDDGSVYVGEIMGSQPDGQGTLITLNGDLFYGDWQDGKQHGRGHYLWVDGRIYIGGFKNGLRHGKGRIFKNGESYEVDFRNGDLISQENGTNKKTNRGQNVNPRQSLPRL